MDTTKLAFEHLAQFPPEIWDQISRCLPGEQLGRFKMTGSKSLWRKLCSSRSVTSVFLGRDMIRFLRWPAFMNELLNIQYMNIKNFSTEWWQAWTFTISCVPPTLRKLKIRTLDVYGSAFFGSTLSSSVVLPLLEDLDINVLWQNQNSWSIHFPQLTTLKVSSWRTSVELPQTLLQLDVSGEISHSVGDTVFIPPHLESLTADEITNVKDLLPRLPSTVRKFRIDRVQCLSLDLSTCPLPPSLTNLGTLSFARIQPSSLPESLFASLLFLTDISVHSFPVSSWKNLPQNLKILRAQATLGHPGIATTVINSGEGAEEHILEFIPFHDLPKSITHLEVSFAPDAETISYIDISGSARKMSIWPFELRKLVLSGRVQMSVDGAKQLPSTLTHLEIPHFYGQICQVLPRGLLTLYATSCVMISPEDLRLLPASLNSLYLQSASENEIWMHPITGVVKIEAELANQSATFLWPNEQCLPSNLTILCLSRLSMLGDSFLKTQRLLKLKSAYFMGSNDFTDLAIPLLPQCLKNLQLGVSPKITGRSFRHLPPTLSWFTCVSSAEIDDSDISHLPRGLKTLELKSATQLTDACIRDLPRSLQYMNLGNCPGITSASFSDLPYSLRLTQHVILSKNDVPILF